MSSFSFATTWTINKNSNHAIDEKIAINKRALVE
jgi:hypothetical protein